MRPPWQLAGRCSQRQLQMRRPLEQVGNYLFPSDVWLRISDCTSHQLELGELRVLHLQELKISPPLRVFCLGEHCSDMHCDVTLCQGYQPGVISRAVASGHDIDVMPMQCLCRCQACFDRFRSPMTFQAELQPLQHIS